MIIFYFSCTKSQTHIIDKYIPHFIFLKVKYSMYEKHFDKINQLDTYYDSVNVCALNNN